MPWNGTMGHAFQEVTLLVTAPAESGVYALWTGNTWVYIGKTKNIRGRLQDHLAETGHCMHRYSDLLFGYELIDRAVARRTREAALLRELAPVCNPQP